MKNSLIKILTATLVLIMTVIPVSVVAISADEYENTHVNTGDYRIDLISVAKTQIGFREGEYNDTKYGTWYGLPNQPWCAMFVSWCARQADIPTSIIRNCAIAAPDDGYFSVPFVDGEEYTPQLGDLFFTKTFSHVGIVYYADGDYFYTLEGNSNDTGSSEGIGVFSLRRKTADYYFGVPEYDKHESADHICDKAVYATSDEAHPHLSLYRCSVCDKLSYDYRATSFDEACPDCNPSAKVQILGDANEGGIVNIKDVTAIQKHAAGIELLSKNGVRLADADQSGEVNVRDATAVQKYLADIPTPYPIGEAAQ